MPAGTDAWRMTTWIEIADRFARVLETGDAAELERLYHPRLLFTVRTVGTVHDRDRALATFRSIWPLLHDVRVEIVDRQATTSGFLSQQVLHATGPDGTRVAVPMCLVFGLRDGLVDRIDEYFDPATVPPVLDAVSVG